MSIDLSRREFIKASAGAAALAVAGLPAPAPAAEPGVTYGRSQCRFCGTGCTVVAGVRNGRIVSIQGDADSPINEGRVCIKGFSLPHILYGKDRLTRPMVRQAGGGFKAVSWNEALDLVAGTFVDNIRRHGKDSVAWYGSGQNATEEAYAANKLFKGVIGTANLEGNPRLCMSSAVGGYLNTFGTDEPAGTYDDLDETDCFFIIGANMAEQHPMLFRRIVNRKNARPDRVKIVVADPRFTPTARYADLHLKFIPGHDMYLLNAMAQVIVEEELTDPEHLGYVVFQKGLGGKGELISFLAFREFLRAYAPEKVAGLVGVPAGDIRTAARWFGRKGHGTVSLWTMGYNQRTQGVELNCQSHNLHLLTGKIGRPGSDSMSLTGQPNACGGTREQGGLTHLLPAHRLLADPKDRAEIAKIWGYPVEQLPDKPTGAAMNMFARLVGKQIKAIWISTTNPGQTLPNGDFYRNAMREAFTVVSDVYPTRTTEQATVILPSAMWIEKEGTMGQTDRRSQLIPKLLDAPGEARPDFWQIVEVAKRVASKLGRKDLGFTTETQAWDEYRLCSRGQDIDLWGATREKLRMHAGGIQWPCPSTDLENRGSAKRFISKRRAEQVFGHTERRYKTGYVTLYDQHMAEKKIPGDINYYGHDPARAASKDKAVVRVLPARTDFEMPDADYPYVLNTGRVLEHWHSGTVTMRVPMLRAIHPSAYVEVDPDDARKLGVRNGDKLQIESRRGKIALRVWVTDRAQPGMVFVPFFDENALINVLTVDDPKSLSAAGQPDYKVCAVRLKKA